MRFRASTRGGGVPQGLQSRRQAQRAEQLTAYLRSIGLTQEAQLACQMATSKHAGAKLFELLHRNKHLPIPPDVGQVEALFTHYFGQSKDVVFRRLALGPHRAKGVLVYLATMVDDKLLERNLSGFLHPGPTAQLKGSGSEAIRWLKMNQATAPETAEATRFDQAAKGVAEGKALLFLEGADRALGFVVSGGPNRSVSESKTERVMRGPREGFVESLKINVTLVRRRIRDPRLRVDMVTVGELTRTDVAVLHIATICKQSLVDEALRRIRRIKVDGIIDSGQLQEFIEDTPWTLFPLVRASERPDAVAGALLEGRVVIIVDGSPFALIAPNSIIDLFHSPEDYYERFPAISLVRFLRFTFAFIAIFGPSLYVALTTFHREMIPTNLLLTIMAAREGVPFPAVLEALIMELGFEVIREAGVRMPAPLGQSVSIVGALILGESAIQAGVVSAPMVITVAVTGLSALLLPDFSTALALRTLRFPMLLLAGILGAYGLTLGATALLIHLLSLRSFGAPYLAPIGPLLPADAGDTLLRFPTWASLKRSAALEQLDARRVEKGLKPQPEHAHEGDSP